LIVDPHDAARPDFVIVKVVREQVETRAGTPGHTARRATIATARRIATSRSALLETFIS
jgi:hypothetical protein